MTSAAQQYLGAEAALLEAIREARGATKDLHREVKQHRQLIADAIVEEVQVQVAAAVAEVRRDAEQRMVKVIDDIRDDWRAKLGL